MTTLSEPPLPEILAAHGKIKPSGEDQVVPAKQLVSISKHGRGRGGTKRSSSYRLRSRDKQVLALSNQLFEGKMATGRGGLRWEVGTSKTSSAVKTYWKAKKSKATGGRSGAVRIYLSRITQIVQRCRLGEDRGGVQKASTSKT